MPERQNNKRFETISVTMKEGKRVKLKSSQLSLCKMSTIRHFYKKYYPAVSLLIMVLLLGACAGPARILQAPPQPDLGHDVFEQAESMFRQQSYEDALRSYLQYLSRYTKGASADVALIRIATIYSNWGDTDAKLEACRKLVSEYPDSRFAPEANFEIMMALFREGKTRDVIRRAADIIKKTDNKELLLRTYMILGDTYLFANSPVDAVFFYYLAYDRADSSQKEKISEKLTGVVGLLKRDDVNLLFKNLGRDSLKGHLLYLLATAEYKSGNYTEAKKGFLKFVEAFPQHEAAEQANLRIEEINRITAFRRERIGCLLPLSGPYAAFGNKVLKGIQLALYHLSFQSNQPDWQLIVRDTGSDPNQVARLVQELDEQKVALIIGPMVASKNAALEAQTRGIPILTLTQQIGIPEIGEYVFRNFLTPDLQVEALLECAVEKFGAGRFAILYPDETYGTTYMKLFRDRATRYGARVVGVASYAPDQTDFSAPIKRLAKISDSEGDKIAAPHRWYNSGRKDRLIKEPLVLGFDAIFIPDEPAKAALIAPQLAYWDVNGVLLMGTNLWHSEQLIANARAYVQDAILSDIYYEKSVNRTVQRFIRAFEEYYGEPPGPFEGLAYDTAMIAFQTAANQEVRSRNDLKDRLKETSYYDGVTGLTSFRPNGDVWKKLYMLQINGPDFVELH